MTPIQLVRVRDGRGVGVRWFGASDGIPIVRLHGAGGSATFEVEPVWTADAGVRMISVERPGLGRSDFTPIADLLDWVPDLEDVADSLGLDQFALFAESAGGPHGLAAAYRLQDRVVAVATVGGVAPAGVETRPGDFADLARSDPAAAARARYDFAAGLRRDPRAALASMVSGPDLDVLRHPVWGADLVAQVVAGTGASEGPSWDLVRVNRPWGFDVADLDQPIAIWHGALDRLIPVAEGCWLAERLPAGSLHVVEHEGHFLPYPCWREIVGDLINLIAGRASSSQRPAPDHS
jgi:pimeloyl-ACP methyl ester carboxylesterase